MTTSASLNPSSTSPSVISSEQPMFLSTFRASFSSSISSCIGVFIPIESSASKAASRRSYSTSIASRALWAISSVSAATAAMGSPTYLGLPVRTRQSL